MNAHLALTKSRWLVGKGGTGTMLENAVKDRATSRTTFYKQLIESFKENWKATPAWYKHRFEQQFRCAEREQSTGFELTCKSPLLIGQGQPSVLEAHVTMHRIYGVPYISGTAIKGIAAHYCDHYLGQRNKTLKAGGETYNVLFGTQKQAGFIVYRDAWLTPATVAGSLLLDVMTPHHQAYNQIDTTKPASSDLAAPRDDDSPVPLSFLAVQGTFQFLLTCENEDAEAANEWLGVAKTIVTAAILQEGLGGKTNAGYGVFQGDGEGNADG